ncbi:MAG TPA: C-terminal binding protein [Candidatus Dormibacteraeota bacterium]|jgi:D-3-phosphoglycerate dehydrogenase|nr:C-terminal binding protein [Candidatus Dormibacteraeota bacterium]
MPERVLVTDTVAVFGSLDVERAVLGPLGLDLVPAPATDEATLAREAASAAAILVVYAGITEPVIAAAARAGCRVIARCGIGVDNIDLEAATRHGIQVTNVPDYCLDEVADHTLALLLCAARGLLPATNAVRDGAWQVPRGGIRRLQGRRLALVGTGRIGRRVGARARAFGLEVIGFDPYLTSWDLEGTERASSLVEAISEADFISLHAPLTPENYHLIDAAAVAAMRRAPVLVNTARGGLVDLEAALRGLEEGRLSALALDVTEVEPLPADHPLRRHPRALITPHMAFYSEEAEHELRRRAAEEVARAIRGEPPRCPVNDLGSRARG